MSFQGYQGKVDPHVGDKNTGPDDGTEMMQLTQVQLAPIVSSAVSQALIQHMQQTGCNPPPITVANHVTQNTAEVQQV